MIIKDNRKVAVEVSNNGPDPVELTVLHPGGRTESITLADYTSLLFWLPVGSYFAPPSSATVSTTGAPLEDIKVTATDEFLRPHYILKEGVHYRVTI